MARKQKTPAGYLRVGKYYVSLSFLLLLSAGFLALLALYATALHPAVIRQWYDIQAIPVFKLDSPYLADYTGNARLVLADGTLLYEGAVMNAAAHGEGRLYENDSLVYEGGFSQNMYHGKGKQYYPDGSPMYEGGFESNKYAGEGVLYTERHGIKYTYVGSFSGGERFGSGKMYRGDELVYEGGFEHDLYHGEGTDFIDGAAAYSGSFVNNLREGQGTEYRDGELLYSGSYSRGAYSGPGKLYGKGDILIYDGEFLSGKYNGYGKLYLNGMLLYEGEFSNGKYNGTGTEYDTETGFPVFSGKYSFNVRMKAGIEYDENGKPIVSSDLPLPRPDPLSLLGRSYSDALTYLMQAGITLKEQTVDGKELLVIDSDAGVIYCFPVSNKRTPDILSRIYYYGLLSAEGIVVGADISDIVGKASGNAGMNTLELLVLGYSNALWGRDVPAAKTHGSVFAGSTYAVTAFYFPPEPQEVFGDEAPESEIITITTPTGPSGRILFLRIETAEKG